jgi:hypothetical protein
MAVEMFNKNNEVRAPLINFIAVCSWGFGGQSMVSLRRFDGGAAPNVSSTPLVNSEGERLLSLWHGPTKHQLPTVQNQQIGDRNKWRIQQVAGVDKENRFTLVCLDRRQHQSLVIGPAIALS